MESLRLRFLINLSIMVFICFLVPIVDSNDIIALRPGLQISTYFKNFSGEIKFPINNEILMFENLKIHSEPNAVLGQVYEINLPMRINASTEILGYRLDEVKLNNTILQSTEYNSVLKYPSNLVTDYPKYINNQKLFPFFNYNKGSINYTAPYLDYKRFKYSNVEVDSVVSFHNLVFGIKKNVKNNLYVYEFSRGSNIDFKRLSLFTNVPAQWDLDSKVIESIHIVPVIGDADTFLLLKSMNNIFIFRLIKELKHGLFEVAIRPHNQLSHQSLIPKVINKILYNDDCFFIGEKSGGIQIYGFDNSLLKDISSFKQNENERKLYLLDMIMLNNSIYAISEDYGLKILNITDPRDASFTEFDFYHPFLRKLDVHKNPYKDHTYVGVLVSDRYFYNGNEFFFELKIEDEFQPTMKRYYLEGEFLDLSYFISDGVFSYLYEHFSNSIYVVIRSNVINEYDSVYKIQISELSNKKVDQEIFFIHNNSTGSNMIGILSESDIIVIEDIYFTAAKLQVQFQELGNYLIKLKTKSDYCEGNKDKVYLNENNVYVCSIDLTLEFDVNRLSFGMVDKVQSHGVFAYLFIVGFMTVFAFIIICYKKLVPIIINNLRDHKYSQEVEEQQNSETVDKKEDENHQIEIVSTEKV